MAGWVARATTSGATRKSGSPKPARTSSAVTPGAKPTAYKPQLYDLQKDPQELTDVADRYPDVCRRMSAKMKEYIASGEGLTLGSFNQKPSLNTGEVYIQQSR